MLSLKELSLIVQGQGHFKICIQSNFEEPRWPCPWRLKFSPKYLMSWDVSFNIHITFNQLIKSLFWSVSVFWLVHVSVDSVFSIIIHVNVTALYDLSILMGVWSWGDICLYAGPLLREVWLVTTSSNSRSNQNSNRRPTSAIGDPCN